MAESKKYPIDNVVAPIQKIYTAGKIGRTRTWNQRYICVDFG